MKSKKEMEEGREYRKVGRRDKRRKGENSKKRRKISHPQVSNPKPPSTRHTSQILDSLTKVVFQGNKPEKITRFFSKANHYAKSWYVKGGGGGGGWS